MMFYTLFMNGCNEIEQGKMILSILLNFDGLLFCLHLKFVLLGIYVYFVLSFGLNNNGHHATTFLGVGATRHYLRLTM